MDELLKSVFTVEETSAELDVTSIEAKLVSSFFAMIDELKPNKGWGFESLAISGGVGFVNIPDGRLAEVQLRIEMDEEEFMREPDESDEDGEDI